MFLNRPPRPLLLGGGFPINTFNSGIDRVTMRDNPRATLTGPKIVADSASKSIMVPCEKSKDSTFKFLCSVLVVPLLDIVVVVVVFSVGATTTAGVLEETLPFLEFFIFLLVLFFFWMLFSEKDDDDDGGGGGDGNNPKDCLS